LRKVHLLPTLLTLANALCGLLAICKGIDALAAPTSEPLRFYLNLSTGAWLIFLAQVFDALDGKVARLVGATSGFGAQIDSLADMLTFGVAPALLAKVLLEHEGPLLGVEVNPRLTFAAAALFSVMALLRLARFNLETDPDPESHRCFRGLPSPAAAGAVASALLVYVSLRKPQLEHWDGVRTPLGDVIDLVPGEIALGWTLPFLWLMLPALGLLMVSRVRYVHMFSALTGRGQFFTLVWVVAAAVLLIVVPIPALFAVFNGYVLIGLVLAGLRRGRAPAEGAA
jgi:CDP-diacylglycerol--serine O-phosphatidyltransferase